LDHARQLEASGAQIVGPFSTARQALAALQEVKVDAAVVDFVLKDRNSLELQEALDRKNVPFVVVSGYPAVLVRRDRDQTVLRKPVDFGALSLSLKRAFHSRRTEPARV
ncbi:MAG TPA: hypothetical protein VE986_05450, partial [Hyphomicrobiales bacterium]|nr:hypothetical protein [Hyphomicrobiales bacterium]